MKRTGEPLVESGVKVHRRFHEATVARGGSPVLGLR